MRQTGLLVACLKQNITVPLLLLVVSRNTLTHSLPLLSHHSHWGALCLVAPSANPAWMKLGMFLGNLRQEIFSCFRDAWEKNLWRLLNTGSGEAAWYRRNDTSGQGGHLRLSSICCCMNRTCISVTAKWVSGCSAWLVGKMKWNDTKRLKLLEACSCQSLSTENSAWLYPHCGLWALKSLCFTGNRHVHHVQLLPQGLLDQGEHSWALCCLVPAGMQSREHSLPILRAEIQTHFC